MVHGTVSVCLRACVPAWLISSSILKGKKRATRKTPRGRSRTRRVRFRTIVDYDLQDLLHLRCHTSPAETVPAIDQKWPSSQINSYHYPRAAPRFVFNPTRATSWVIM